MTEELIITGGRLLCDDGGAISDGFIWIKDGLIKRFGSMADLAGMPLAGREVDARNCLVMPGLVNTHNHSAMTLFRGLADDLPLAAWLNEHIFPAEARHVNPEMVYHCSKLAAAEMLLSGTTTVGDGYFFEGEAVRAFTESGMRAVAAQGVIDFPAPGVADPAGNIEEARKFIGAWQDNSLVTPAVFCHSPYTCSAETLVAAKEMAGEFGSRLFIHLAETRSEVDDSLSQLGKTPVRHLADLGILDQDTTCVHCVWLNDEDIGILRDSGAAVASCPESNMKLAAGVAPLDRILAAGIPLGLGTDGCASNNDLDLFGEMASAARIHKVISSDPTLLPAREVVGFATRGGAEVLGLSGQVGSLAPGMAADLIMLDLSAAHLTPFYDLPALLVYSARGADVKNVMVNGKMVVENRQLCNMDLAESIGEVNRLAEGLREPV